MSGRSREAVASTAQYLLLGGCAAVAAGISSQGLTGFARANMGLQGPWPYLLFFALDGAAGVCAVLLTRRAARAESATGPRLAVWGLVGASASFNWAHSPQRAGAPEAFAMMPVVCAVLFEFTLGELRQRKAGRGDRRLSALRWARPVERLRVQLVLAADERLSADAATRRVRADLAARRLYQLRLVLVGRDRAARPGTVAAWRVRGAERRAHAALTRAGFTDPATAAAVLRQVQVLTQTLALARLDYSSAAAGHAVIAGLISREPRPVPLPQPGPGHPGRPPESPVPLGAESSPPASDTPADTQGGQGSPGAAPGPDQDEESGPDGDQDAGLDSALVEAAARVLGESPQLAQKALGARLRLDGHRVANHSLRALLAEASALVASSEATGERAAGEAAAARPGPGPAGDAPATAPPASAVLQTGHPAGEMASGA